MSLLVWVIVICHCNKSEMTSCGCDSPILDSVINTYGVLYYEPVSKQYYIRSVGLNVDGTTSIVCDTNSPPLRPYLDSAKQVSAVVKFSGKEHSACFSDTIMYIGKWVNINLTNLNYY